MATTIIIINHESSRVLGCRRDVGKICPGKVVIKVRRAIDERVLCAGCHRLIIIVVVVVIVFIVVVIILELVLACQLAQSAHDLRARPDIGHQLGLSEFVMKHLDLRARQGNRTRTERAGIELDERLKQERERKRERECGKGAVFSE